MSSQHICSMLSAALACLWYKAALHLFDQALFLFLSNLHFFLGMTHELFFVCSYQSINQSFGKECECISQANIVHK